MKPPKSPMKSSLSAATRSRHTLLVLILTIVVLGLLALNLHVLLTHTADKSSELHVKSSTALHQPNALGLRSVEKAEPAPTEPLPIGPVASVLHARTEAMKPLEGLRLRIQDAADTTQSDVMVSSQQFAQHGIATSGVHVRMKNQAILSDVTNRESDALLLILVLNDGSSWGPKRSVDTFFQQLDAFSYPQTKTSLTVLTSDLLEFERIKTAMETRIHQYAQFSLLFRSDFNVDGVLTRKNRHDTNLQATRRRMIARYRNFALLSTLEAWHQHVVWLDADVFKIPRGLIAKMVHADRDIIEPICYQGSQEYDLNAWVGTRKKRPQDPAQRQGFVPDGLHVKHMKDFVPGEEDFVPLDSVGGTMLYVRADVHRQGVLFPHHYVIGSEWDEEGYDGIETEGLCYEAHFLGFKCWGLPHEAIHHVIQ